MVPLVPASPVSPSLVPPRAYRTPGRGFDARAAGALFAARWEAATAHDSAAVIYGTAPVEGDDEDVYFSPNERRAPATPTDAGSSSSRWETLFRAARLRFFHPASGPEAAVPLPLLDEEETAPHAQLHAAPAVPAAVPVAVPAAVPAAPLRIIAPCAEAEAGAEVEAGVQAGRGAQRSPERSPSSPPGEGKPRRNRRRAPPPDSLLASPTAELPARSPAGSPTAEVAARCVSVAAAARDGGGDAAPTAELRPDGGAALATTEHTEELAGGSAEERSARGRGGRSLRGRGRGRGRGRTTAAA